MGFIKPALPDLDYEEWRTRSRMERLKPMVQDWAERGFGPPEGVYLVYVLKIGLYVLGALFFAATTPGIGTVAEFTSWWTEPVVFQKVVIWTLLFEVLGFGCGFGPLTLRFLPPIGGFLYWLRPGTIRLAPWPDRVPGTSGTTRTPVDVLLYAGVIGSALWLLLSPGSRDNGPLDGSVGLIDPARLLPLLIGLALLGLRDKTIFLAARSEIYGLLALVFFFPPVDMIIAAKLVMLAIWWGAATSKLNRHFPHIVATMMTNSPIIRVKAIKRLFHKSPPHDIRPSGVSTFLAHLGTVVEFTVPLALLLFGGGLPTVVAATIMIVFHLHILSALPMGVPLEWNVFMCFGILLLFVHNAQYGVGDLANPLPVALLMAAVVALVLLGNFFPRVFSFLLSMRYYAGNWATSMWCLTPSAIAKLDSGIVGFPGLARSQLATLYGDQVADLLAHKGYAFRAMHTHGRALFGLIPRAAGPDHETTHIPIDGEFVAGPTIGWNFGEGHLHNEQLLAALQERCHFTEGEVRVIMLESQPMHRQRQEYRLVDAVTGEFERGYVSVTDMLSRQAWAGEIPVDVVSRATTTTKGVAEV
ncbi:MAG TPA: DUF3556 domain-containing protein [Mycobacteriales bacterium]|nr:DUF3556 domain-containing protein [Mycobacteriales bacterium]